MAKLSIIEGIGDAYENKLKEAGIASVQEYLDATTTRKGRKVLADKTGISESLILKWTNHADLIRIKGIGGEYAELLEASGVDTVVELAKRKADKLWAKIVEVNGNKKYVRKRPAPEQVADWIKQAAELPRVVKH